MLKVLAISALSTSMVAAEEIPPMPSGLDMKFQELLFPEENQMFLGITAAELGKLDFEQADKDLEQLCKLYALPIAEETGAKELTIRLSDQPLPFGEVNSEIAQFMGIYDVSQGSCEWL